MIIYRQTAYVNNFFEDF